MERSEIKVLLKGESINVRVNVKGWVRTKRVSKNVAFITLNDGSTINNIQIVVDLHGQWRRSFRQPGAHALLLGGNTAYPVRHDRGRK